MPVQSTSLPAETVQTVRLAAELQGVLGALQAAGVTALAFKGPTLSALAFERLDRAASSDLDLMVLSPDVPRALQVLHGLGYAWKGVGGDPHLTGNNEAALSCPGRTEIDLHWELSPVYFIPFDLPGAFRRAQTVRLIGRDFPTLGNEDLFVALAIHHSRHCWNSVEWIRDVAYLARKQRDRIDWDLVFQLATPTGARRVVHLAILLAEEFQPGVIPAAVVERARGDRGAGRLATQVRHNLEHFEGDFAGTPAGAWMQMRMFETWGGGVRYLWRRFLLPNQTDAEALPLPGWLRPLFFVLRPFRILWKALRQMVER